MRTIEMPNQEAHFNSQSVVPSNTKKIPSHTKFDEGTFWNRIPDYEGVSTDEFISNSFQIKNSLSNHSDKAKQNLLQFIENRTDRLFRKDVELGLAKAPMIVQLTPYILSRIDWENPHLCPIRTQFIPLGSRAQADHPMVRLDSLEEKNDTKASGLVHRYHDKVLFLPQTTCPVYCRYCTRSYAIGEDTDTVNKFKIEGTPKAWIKAFEYIKENPQIEDIVVSGGDSYNLNPKFISTIANNILDIDSVRRVRIATKGLAVNPGKVLSDQKWTDAVVDFAERGKSRGKQVVIHTHFNSSNEFSWITREAMSVLFQAGVTVRNQSVLIRGVNDSIQKMADLIKRLGYLQIQPYYVYQHDLVKGVEDLRTSLATCLAIEHGVRGITAGFFTPTFVVDAPGGGGKRTASTYDYYNLESGVSVFSAPSVKRNQDFIYVDPLHTLDREEAKEWSNPSYQKMVVNRAKKTAGRFREKSPSRSNEGYQYDIDTRFSEGIG